MCRPRSAEEASDELLALAPRRIVAAARIFGSRTECRPYHYYNLATAFWARGHDKQAGHQREPYTLPGAEFTRRWAMHILPKGFVKSRAFGGFSCRHRESYLGRCRTLLGVERLDLAPTEAAEAEPVEESERTRRCPRCQTPMERISQDERLSWREVLNGPHCPLWYDPFKHAIFWGCLHWYREPPDG